MFTVYERRKKKLNEKRSTTTTKKRIKSGSKKEIKKEKLSGVRFGKFQPNPITVQCRQSKS